MNSNIIKLKKIGDSKGYLTPIETQNEIPFDIKRVYYIYNVKPGERRGYHAHRKLQQVLICVSGSVKILVKTPHEEIVYNLEDPAKGLYIGNMVWREMFDFSEDAVLLVLASEHFTEEDYIRDYTLYMKEACEYFS